MNTLPLTPTSFDTLKLCFVQNKEERLLPKKYLTLYPDWTLSLKIKEAKQEGDTFTVTQEAMSLEIYDRTCRYLDCENFWKLPTNELDFLKVQGIVTSFSYDAATSTNSLLPKEKIFAWKMAKFELDSTVNFYQCKSVEEYTKMWKYLKYNSKIAPCQMIYIEDGSLMKSCYYKIGVLIVNGYPIVLKERIKFSTVVEATGAPSQVTVCTQHLHPDSLDADKYITCNFGKKMNNTLDTPEFLVDAYDYTFEFVSTAKPISMDEVNTIPVRNTKYLGTTELYLQNEGTYRRMNVYCGYVKLK